MAEKRDFAVSSPVSAQQPTVQRKVLLTEDLPIPGYQTVMATIEIPAGGREGRHTHPGAVVVYIPAGVFTFEHEGKATMTYKAGDSLYIEPNKIHEDINRGTSPVKALRLLCSKRANHWSPRVP